MAELSSQDPTTYHPATARSVLRLLWEEVKREEFSLLADVVSRQRAVDRSADQQVVRCEASIGIISNAVIDNTQAVGSTRVEMTSVTPASSTHRSVSGDVPRGCLWRFTEAATDLPRTCEVHFRDLQDLGVFKNQAGLFLFHTGLEIFTLLHG